MLSSDVEGFLSVHRVLTTEDGEVLLTRDDAYRLLAALLQSGGPLPVYVDVYSRATGTGLQFVEDLTMRDIHNTKLGRREYWENICTYLCACDPTHLVSLRTSLTDRK